MATILNRAFAAVAADPRPRSLARLRYGLRQGYLGLASRYVKDPDSTCRWQAAIVVGEFIATRRARVWRVARDLAKAPNADMRMAAATVLLEHLLEYYPQDMIPRVRAEIAAGDRRFATSVTACFNFGNSRTRGRIQRLLDEAKAV